MLWQCVPDSPPSKSIEQEHLLQRALEMGALLREKLQQALAEYEMVEQIRGVGLFCGIEFSPAQTTTAACRL